jgi:farnesyl diphosphate synthase
MTVASGDGHRLDIASSFATRLAEAQSQIETALIGLLAAPDGDQRRLYEAMRYSCLDGGKRFRAFLSLETGKLLGVSLDQLLPVAAAIECVHCYSLIHDDLPCMDDDDFRRGKPTVHKAFDEATAVLAGDALLSLAFDHLAHFEGYEADVKLALIQGLSSAIGGQGMLGGQMIDMSCQRTELNLADLTHLHRLKTGALIEFSVDAAAIIAGVDGPMRDDLRHYAQALGLAFQIHDDVLDASGKSEILGKTAGKDMAAKKNTFVSLLGLEGASLSANDYAQQAVQYLAGFEGCAVALEQAAAFVVGRER